MYKGCSIHISEKTATRLINSSEFITKKLRFGLVPFSYETSDRMATVIWPVYLVRMQSNSMNLMACTFEEGWILTKIIIHDLAAVCLAAILDCNCSINSIILRKHFSFEGSKLMSIRIPIFDNNKFIKITLRERHRMSHAAQMLEFASDCMNTR